MLKRKRESFLAATDAAAFVIFAVLIITIAGLATTAYLAINAPIETEECEYKHASVVADDFSVLASTIDRLMPTQTSGASTSVPVTLVPTKESLIALSLSPGSLTFAPADGTVTVRATDPGTNSSGSWVLANFVNNVTRSQVTLQGRLQGPPYSSGYLYSNLSQLEGHIGKDTGSNNTVYGTFSWQTTIPSADTQIILRIRSDMFPDMRHAKEWYNCPALESQNGTNTVPLAGISSVSNGHRYIQFRAELKTWDPNITPTLHNNVTLNFSSPAEPVTLGNASGTISFTSSYHYHPNLVLSYGNGGVLQSQAEGGFVVNPNRFQEHFEFGNSSGRPRANISLIALRGANTTFSGPSAAFVRLYRSSSEIIANPFYYPNLTITLTSANPTDPPVYRRWFRESLFKAGLHEGEDYAVQVNTTAKTVTVTLGHEEGVELYLTKMEVLASLHS